MVYTYPEVRKAQEAVATAWLAVTDGDIAAALKTLKKLSSSLQTMHKREQAELVALASHLRTYPYSELQGIPDATRDELALTAAWRAILNAMSLSYASQVWTRSELLPVIIGRPYRLNLEPGPPFSEGRGNPTEVLPDAGDHVPREQQALPWPQLSRLPDLSLAARTVLVRAIQHVHLTSGGLVCCTSIGHAGIPELEDGFAELSNAGLLDPALVASDLLMDLTLKSLKQFAFDHGLTPHGDKYHLVKAIVQQVAEQDVERLLNLAKDGTQARVRLADLHLVKPYVYSEQISLDGYIAAVVSAYRLQRPRGVSQSCTEVRIEKHQSSATSNPTTSDRRAGAATPPEDLNVCVRSQGITPKSAHDWLAYLRDPICQTEIAFVRQVWDAECDRIVEDLVSRYAWNAMWYISDAVAAYLPPERLSAFKEACERRAVHGWSNVLMYYGQARVAEMGIKVPEPKTLTCANCGERIVEWSIPFYMARKVGCKIHFCLGCYGKALDGNARCVQLPEPEMLSRLAELAALLGTVPPSNFLIRPDLASLADETQIAVVKALIAMPPYQAYVQAFGSWFQSLVLAGVLEAGAQRLPRGTRCLASDGHVCLSLAEKAIDDWLSRHGVPHKKEPRYPTHPRLNPSGQIRGDWQVEQVMIEYAGLMGEPDYSARIDTKRELARAFGLSLILIEPKDILDLDRVLERLVASEE